MAKGFYKAKDKAKYISNMLESTTSLEDDYFACLELLEEYLFHVRIKALSNTNPMQYNIDWSEIKALCHIMDSHTNSETALILRVCAEAFLDDPLDLEDYSFGDEMDDVYLDAQIEMDKGYGYHLMYGINSGSFGCGAFEGVIRILHRADLIMHIFPYCIDYVEHFHKIYGVFLVLQKTECTVITNGTFLLDLNLSSFLY